MLQQNGVHQFYGAGHPIRLVGFYVTKLLVSGYSDGENPFACHQIMTVVFTSLGFYYHDEIAMKKPPEEVGDL